ncbi:S1 RNA-binding domain-containing protein 1 [Amphibalanus amphitrite]|uniref:S1 RNA-binding domain-containing protein 1 n=1 Tax=Amphibalanus amphitrite TaxID=1232801 RepID=A0A6A4VK73_AMPAM|nr:S1 RNA-binding domain-containing protein 1 [Amphibalanus amphitrite]
MREPASGDAEDIQLDIPLLLSQQHHLDLNVSFNISQLLDDDHKVSFIARYRKAQTNDIDPEVLHEVAASHSYLHGLQTAVSKAYKQLSSEQKEGSSDHAGGAGARRPVWSRHALCLLHGSDRCVPTALIHPGTEGRQSLDQVQASLSNLLCDMIGKDVAVTAAGGYDLAEWSAVVQMASHPGIHLESKQKTSKNAPPNDQSYKYRNYFNFRKPDALRHQFTNFCLHRFLSRGMADNYRESSIRQAVGTLFSKSVTRQLERQVRHSLKEAAEREALAVMSRNLKAKLLTPPIRGRVILALDPGYRACKVAVVSAQGAILETAVLNPRLSSRWPEVGRDPAAEQLRRIIAQHGVTLLGVGNGTACRETWQYVSELNGAGALAAAPLDVTLVDEGGASEYSTSPAAAAEMAELDCTVRSAVSLARRLQDPISELVKVSQVLGDVLSDCVAAVGVDLNTASVQLLKKVPGLNAASAENIMAKRRAQKLFVNRQQLLSVKGIGPKSFEQCAGFVRVLPATAAKTGKKSGITPKKGSKAASTAPEPLDQTVIHPESYPVANRLLQLIGCPSSAVGSPDLVSRLTEFCAARSRPQLAEELETDIHTLELIIRALSEPGYDERQELAAPMFWKAAMRAGDLRPGARLRGVVRNPTEFGAFVDLGIGESGLIHHSQMRSVELRVNDHVEVEVIKVEQKPKKTDIGLRLLHKIEGKQLKRG